MIELLTAETTAPPPQTGLDYATFWVAFGALIVSGIGIWAARFVPLKVQKNQAASRLEEIQAEHQARLAASNVEDIARHRAWLEQSKLEAYTTLEALAANFYFSLTRVYRLGSSSPRMSDVVDEESARRATHFLERCTELLEELKEIRHAVARIELLAPRELREQWDALILQAAHLASAVLDSPPPEPPGGAFTIHLEHLSDLMRNDIQRLPHP